jgi:2-desacetyl-2-hydroxyethyl bacteriochlorophyllide A dehydrogenase
MKSVVIQEPGQVAVFDRLPVPEPKENEALLQILYCGICGADLASYLGNQPFTTYPRIPGHEFSARIVSIPQNAGGLKEGDLVTCNPYFNCGDCYACRRGYVNCCVDNQTMGVQRDGAFQEYVVMPVSRILRGDGLNARQLALVEPFCIGHHGISRCKLKNTDKVLVVGAGPIGIFAMLSAKAKGAEVYMADVLDGRLETALQMGASGVVNSGKQDLGSWTRKITDGNGFDVCVEACGLPQTFLSCIDQAAQAANIVLIGNGKRETKFLHSIILKKELNIFGSRNALTSDFEQVIEILRSGEVDVEKLVSCEYPIDQAAEAFDALAHNDGSIMKVLLKIIQE